MKCCGSDLLLRTPPSALHPIRLRAVAGIRLVWHWTFSWSYLGQEEGLQPGTCQPVSFAGVSIYELREGQIARKDFVTDDLAFMEQLGFAPVFEEGTSTTSTSAA